MSKEESELIKIIRDNDVLNKADAAISKEYENIKDVYKKLGEGVLYNIQNPTPMLEFHLIMVALFYSNNCIVQDELSKYKKFFNKGIEASILNNVMYATYSSQKTLLDYNFCSYFIEYCNFSDLEKFIANYNIQHIEIDEEGLEMVYLSIVNYFKSFFRDSGNTLASLNHKLYYQINKTLYGHKFTDFFNNISLLLRIVKLKDEHIAIIGELIIKVISNTNLFYPKHIHNLKHFIYGNKDVLKVSFFESFLAAMNTKTEYLSSDILEVISQSFSEKPDEDRVGSIEIVGRVLESVDNKRIFGYRKESLLFYLWIVVNDKNREMVKSRIIASLNNEFSSRLYWLSVINGIIDYKIFFDKYKEEALASEASVSQYEIFEYSLRGKNSDVKEGLNNYVINFIRMAYKLGLVPDEEIDQLFDKHDLYIKFFLNPDKFNYDLFEIKWLLYVADRNIHEHLARIPAIKEIFSSYLRENKSEDYLDLYVRFYI